MNKFIISLIILLSAATEGCYARIDMGKYILEKSPLAADQRAILFRICKVVAGKCVATWSKSCRKGTSWRVQEHPDPEVLR